MLLLCLVLLVGFGLGLGILIGTNDDWPWWYFAVVALAGWVVVGIVIAQIFECLLIISGENEEANDGQVKTP